MKVITGIKNLQQELDFLRKNSQKIGLVPTMGALHEGHLSLVRKSIERGDAVVVSVFVNPTQFNDPKDLERYPRHLEKDLSLLAELDIKYVFAPSVEEMYPEKDLRIFNLSPLDTVLEGRYRPGHFNGVAQIVSKLFDAVLPDRAYFGLKDFQQLAIIKKLVLLQDYQIEIIGCPIVRENDGLAMSSRNQLLSTNEREAAPHIYNTLRKAKERAATTSPPEIKEFVYREINNHPLMKIDYYEIVEELNLTPILDWNEKGNKIACIAVHLGEVRLIDNLKFD